MGKETVQIVERGEYTMPSGARVSIAAEVARAVEGTRLYTPEELVFLEPLPFAAVPCRIEVTGETTGAAARRLVEREGETRVAALNFASAKNPGGGFLGGAKAQEEDLARCSALYACQLTQRAYYDENRASGSMIYTDHLIYSPDVPFFRDERLDLLPAPFLVSILTSPAPNAGEELRRRAGARPQIRAALERRADHVLRVAAAEGHRVLVLGAWGCGVFRNDPTEVADAFAKALAGPRLAGAFARIVFAVYDRSPNLVNRRAFEQRFDR
ncbi:Hypothetical protein A7982_00964 [Minicystis rosea]|nr:Hypothetical protein A7982_00964 [Minicystis rosea]